eukprot:CAMPEP_0173463576 /NCGR_PEP_ID=MMETSP1357-20121228/68519_1 /TAXON_ID=77926 /ORGANISM="Hemiselmis rufescens, Strain PCC563" /LENGTH=37 /DNA_ID= /DNA_START= /DNA_END= /DNA_ORIENTATION=
MQAAGDVVRVLTPDFLSLIWEDATEHARTPKTLTVKW